MNTDIRLSVSFWDHPKTVKLERRLGLAGVKSLQILWMWAANNKPDGVLANARRTPGERPANARRIIDDAGRSFGAEDIEIAARWNGEQNTFTETLVALGWLDEIDGGYLLHGWSERNSWAAKADERGDKARFSRLAQVAPEVFETLRCQGVTAVSKEEYELIIDERQRNASAAPAKRQRNASAAPAPSPSPSPSPSPYVRNIADQSCQPGAPATKPSVKRFTPPTLEQVTAYCLERSSNVDPQRWMNHYTSNGWRVGKNPMKDWKAAVRTWESEGDNGGQQQIRPRTVRDALNIQGEQIARILNDEERKKQHFGPAHCQEGGVLLEHQI